MARTLAKVALVVIILACLVLGALRYAAGALVASEGFRETLSRQLERALRPFVPHALVTLEESELTGVATVVLRRVSVRSEEKIDASMTIQELGARPRWQTLLLPGATELSMEARFSGEGSAIISLVLPLKALLREQSGDDPAVELTAAFTKIDAPSALALALAAGRGLGPRLARGFVDGEIAISKEIGDDRATSKKTGHATLRFYEAAYILEERDEPLAPFAAAVELRDYKVKIAPPFVIETQTHKNRVVVAGLVLLPNRAEQSVSWDLDMTATGKPRFLDDLGNIFHCQTPPSAPHFRITGAVADARCSAVAQKSP